MSKGKLCDLRIEETSGGFCARLHNVFALSADGPLENRMRFVHPVVGQVCANHDAALQSLREHALDLSAQVAGEFQGLLNVPSEGVLFRAEPKPQQSVDLYHQVANAGQPLRSIWRADPAHDHESVSQIDFTFLNVRQDRQGFLIVDPVDFDTQHGHLLLNEPMA